MVKWIAIPAVTFTKLLDYAAVTPTYRARAQNYRAHGTVAMVHLALSGLPKFGEIDSEEMLSGRIHIGPDIDYLERAFDAAKYGDISPRPYMNITIPTLSDSSLAPRGAHVMSIHAQFAPYKLKSGDWDSRRGEICDIVVDALSDYAPNLKEIVVVRKGFTPA